MSGVLGSFRFARLDGHISEQWPPRIHVLDFAVALVMPGPSWGEAGAGESSG